MAEVKVNIVGPFKTDLNSPIDQQFIIFGLNEADGTRGIHLWADPIQSAYVVAAMHEVKMSYTVGPYTLISLIQKAQLKVEKVVISVYVEPSFYAVIHVKNKKEKITVHAKPTDAITVAIKLNCNVFANEEFLKKEEFIDMTAVKSIPKEKDDWENWLKNIDPDKIPKA